MLFFLFVTFSRTFAALFNFSFALLVVALSLAFVHASFRVFRVFLLYIFVVDNSDFSVSSEFRSFEWNFLKIQQFEKRFVSVWLVFTGSVGFSIFRGNFLRKAVKFLEEILMFVLNCVLFDEHILERHTNAINDKNLEKLKITDAFCWRNVEMQ